MEPQNENFASIESLAASEADYRRQEQDCLLNAARCSGAALAVRNLINLTTPPPPAPLKFPVGDPCASAPPEVNAVPDAPPPPPAPEAPSKQEEWPAA